VRLLGETPGNELALVSGVSLLGQYRAPKQGDAALLPRLRPVCKPPEAAWGRGSA